MRALDSNALLRYLVEDDPSQFAIAMRIMDECREEGEQLFITVLVLYETIWVLERIYQRFKQSRADFPDYLIGEIASAAGCRDTVTFDRSLKGSPGFTIL